MFKYENVACVEIWYNRTARSWVAQYYTSDGHSPGSDYAGNQHGALAYAHIYNVPIFRTNTYGERM
jgi:hypothetical protein